VTRSREKYNAVSKAIMDEQQIPIDDLHSAIPPYREKYWLAPNNVPFNEEGSAFLGTVVANSILGEMERRHLSETQFRSTHKASLIAMTGCR